MTIDYDTLQKILTDMKPNPSNSIEVRVVHQMGDGNSPTSLLIAEVVNDCGFSEYPRGRLVLLPNNDMINIRVGNDGRRFTRVKSILGQTKKIDWLK